jgi:hypothetical protein
MFGRIIALLLLVGLVVLAGSAVYNAGVSAGIAADVGSAIASGEPVPVGVYGPYVGHRWGWGGWGWGGGFFGILFGILFLFLIFGLLRAAFGWGRWGGGPGGYKGSGWDHHRSRRHEQFEEWHREQHGDAPAAPEAPDKPQADRV